MTFALAAVPVVFLIWLALRRPRLRSSGVVGGVSEASLFDNPNQRVDDVRIVHMVELGTDIIVDLAPDADRANECSGALDSMRQVLLQRVVLDGDSMLLLHRWHADHTRLTMAASFDRKLVGLADWRSRRAVITRYVPTTE